MICLKPSHWVALAASQARDLIAQERSDWYKERIAALEKQRDALSAEVNALITQLQEADSLIANLQNAINGGGAGRTRMPSQARDWSQMANTLEARAELENLKRQLESQQ